MSSVLPSLRCLHAPHTRTQLTAGKAFAASWQAREPLLRSKLRLPAALHGSSRAWVALMACTFKGVQACQRAPEADQAAVARPVAGGALRGKGWEGRKGLEAKLGDELCMRVQPGAITVTPSVCKGGMYY